jgi:hypothetical protein
MPHLRIIEPAQAEGPLAEVYERMRGRKMPDAYKPAHGGVPGIIRAHSLDAALMPRVFAFSSGVNQGGPLSWPERELIAATVSRLNQCFY